MQYFNRLNWSAFILTLMLFRSGSAFSQSELRKIFRVQFDSLSSVYTKLSPVKIWNSNQIEMQTIQIRIQDYPFYFFLKVMKDGVILCFEDSLLRKPIRLAKRNIWPFQSLNPVLHYSIQISNQRSFNGFIGIRLFCIEKRKYMDEVFFCLPIDGAVLNVFDS